MSGASFRANKGPELCLRPLVKNSDENSFETVWPFRRNFVLLHMVPHPSLQSSLLQSSAIYFPLLIIPYFLFIIPCSLPIIPLFCPIFPHLFPFFPLPELAI